MNYKIKEMNEELQPRERFIKYGVESLGNDELLAIIIRCGNKYQNAKELAISLLNDLDSIEDLKSMSIEELQSKKGIGLVTAITILSSIELGKRVLNNTKRRIRLLNHNDIYNLFKYEYIGEKQEKLITCFLDTKLNLISYKVIFIGTLNQSTVHPREIFKEAVKRSSSKIIIIHNHPSGNPKPSLSDEVFTEKIKKLGEELDIPLIDHIIIGNNKYYSILEKREYINEETI